MCSGSTLASGATCELGGSNNRPILGLINLCPRFFEMSPDVRLTVLLHELTHALVGDGRLLMFGWWLDAADGVAVRLPLMLAGPRTSPAAAAAEQQQPAALGLLEPRQRR
jgi:hypothetical protein